MNVLSLFDGISCLQLALQRANIPYENYYASEIKKIAIKVTQHHFPNTIQLGDVNNIYYENGTLYNDNNSYTIPIDLVAFGSPCQSFSLINDSYEHPYGLKGKSGIFYEALRLLKEIKPKWWLFENVRMKKESKKQLDEYLGVEGIEINSALFSYQNRPRIYWTNIPIAPIIDKHISFQDYKDTDALYCKQFKLPRNKTTLGMAHILTDNRRRFCKDVTYADKICCITTKQYRPPNAGIVKCEDFYRLLTPHELEQGQTLPIDYTSMLSYNQQQNVIGDGWTVDVIAHILGGIKMEMNVK